MKVAPDVTVTVNFHREGAFAIAALASLSDLVKVARASGIAVETQAILDRPDELTRHIVSVQSDWIDTLEEVSFGDLGLSRNAGTCLARGRFLAFLDGDDLWGEHWLRAAFEAATMPGMPQDAIWHPEYQYVFTEPEFDRMPQADTLLIRRMQSSDTPGFNPLSLVFHSPWSANAFATRELHVRFPYCTADRTRGMGIEDWSWNLETIGAGVPHRVVPGAVHLIRRKGSGSLMRQNTTDYLLPCLSPSCIWGPMAFADLVKHYEPDGDRE
jgi:hypothetical protein